MVHLFLCTHSIPFHDTPPSDEDQVALLAAYEIYAKTHLTWSHTGPDWLPDQPCEITRLQDEIRKLKLQHTPPSEAELVAGPTLELIDRWRNLPAPPPWLLGALNVYHTWLSTTPSPTPNDSLLELWPCLVAAYFKPHNPRSQST